MSTIQSLSSSKSFFDSIEHMPNPLSKIFRRSSESKAVTEHIADGHQNTDQPLTVVELFQSQGCNSCPPANANLIDLVSGTSTNPSNVLLLTYHVTYWDYLGWKDSFGQKIFDQRQRDYVSRMRLRSAFTPQVIVNGKASGVGNSRGGLVALLREGGAGKPMPVNLSVVDGDDGQLLISILPSPSVAHSNALHVSLVTYSPQEIKVSIPRGENAGQSLPHINVVKDISSLGVSKSNEEAVFDVKKIPHGLEGAILVQDGRGGPVVGIAKLH